MVRGSDTYAYSYDAGGNLLSVTKNGTVVQSYTYGNTAWKDLLTAYNGQTITYDAIGNPLSYYNGTRWSFTWENGRSLATASGDGKNISYTYDATGLRTSKTVGTTTTEYFWLGDTLQAQKTGDEYQIFLYDENGTPYGFIQKNGSTETYYYYIFNLQGDVIGILNASGTEVATYTYDAWGNILSITGDTIGQANPLRYRGYYYDSETGFYYLQSRYYDPTTGRFLNADSQIDENAGLSGFNLFSYCANNPIVFKDTSGKGIIGACIVMGFAIGALYGGLKGAEVSQQELGYVDGYYVAAGIAIYGGMGALVGWGFGAAAAALGVGTTASISGSLTHGLCQSWQAAEQAIRTMFNGVKHSVSTPYGMRFLDCLSGKVAYEVKYGYTCLTDFILKQIEKDVWLLMNGYVDYVEWHFFWSNTSQTGGASQPLIDALINAGITIVYH